jgi:type I restriction-modification system DNA methylase subunit
MADLSQQIASHLSEATDLLRNIASSSKAAEYFVGLFLVRLFSSHLPSRTSYKKEHYASADTNPTNTADLDTWETISQSVNPCERILTTIRSFQSRYDSTAFDFLMDLDFDELCRRPDIFRRLVEIVSRIELPKHPGADLGEIANPILSALSQSMGAQSGQFFTPPGIIDLMVELIDPQPNSSILDPTCGSGSLLLTAYRYAAQKGDPTSLHIRGREINPSIAKITRFNAYLHGLSAEIVDIGDALADPLPELQSDKGFDYVLMNPPMGLRRHKADIMHLEHSQSYFRYGSPTTIADYDFMQLALSKLSDNGKAAILVSLRPLFASGEEAQTRKNIVEADLIDSVITLSGNVLAHTAAQPAIIIFQKNKPPERRGKILFVQADNEGAPVGKSHRFTNQPDIVEAYRNLLSKRKFSALVSIQEVSSKDYVLLPSIYVGLAELDVFLGSDVLWVKLGQIASVMPGTKLGHLAEGILPVIQGRDLTVTSLTIEDLSRKDIPPELGKAVYAQEGDVLIQRIGQSPQSILVTKELSGIITADTVYVIRFNERDDLRSRYIVEFLNSASGQAKLSTAIGGAVIPTLRLSSLRNLEIPIPNQSVMELIKDLYVAETALLDRANQASSLRKQLFSSETPDEFNERLQSMSVEAQVLSQSIVQSGSVNFQIRNYYPFVIAYPYRSLDAINNETELYKEQLRVAENILAFLGSIGLALIVATRSILLQDTKSITKQMIYEYWQNGISPGSWQEMANRSASMLRSNDQFAAARSFASIWYKGKGGKQSHFGKLIQDLVARKNDFKHDRGPQTSYEYIEQANALARDLDECLKEIAFFIQYPMRLVVDADVDWKTSKASLNTLVYMGDHPGLRRERVVVAKPAPKDKLYLEVKEDTLIPLYPLISVHYCNSCKTKETYLVDRWNPLDGRTVIKSFERGHTHDNDDIAKQIASDLEYWLQDAFPDAASS